MKTFHVEKHSGNRLVIYPKRITYLSSNGPYIEITPRTENVHGYEVVRQGQVRQRGNLWFYDEEAELASIRRIIELMKEL